MKLLFVHDHPFMRSGEQVFTGGSFPASLWETYINNDVVLLRVFGRESKKRQAKAVSSRENVAFTLSKHYTSPKDFWIKRESIKKEIRQSLEGMDGAIVRLPSFLGLLAIGLCEKKGIPYAVEVVGNAYDSLHNYGSFFGRIAAGYIDRLNKKEILNASYAIYVTRYYLQAHYPCNGITEYASDVEVAAGDTAVKEQRLAKIRSGGAAGKILKVGTIGNVEVKYKGYSVLLQVMSRLKKEGYHMEYFIAGAGNPESLMAEAETLNIAENVHCLGTLDREKIFSYLDDLDVYIHPAFLEGLPRSVVEAMSRALPILASDVGGIPELLDLRYLHHPGDTDKLTEDILKIFKHEYVLSEMALQNWEKAKEYHSGDLKDKRRRFFQRFYDTIK